MRNGTRSRRKRVGLIVALSCVMIFIGVVVGAVTIKTIDSAESNVFTLNTMPSGIDDFGDYR